MFRLVGDHAEEVLSGDRFSPRDRLRFSVDLPAEGHVSVVGVEAGGALYTAWPLEPGVQTRFAAVKGIELPGAVVLDEQPGRETLYLVHRPLQVGHRSQPGRPGRVQVCFPSMEAHVSLNETSLRPFCVSGGAPP